MLVAGLLLSATLTAPLAPRADSFVSAFAAGDVAGMIGIWSDDSPSRAADRKRLAGLLREPATLRFVASVDEQRGLVCLDLYEDADLVEQYELQFRREGGEWRAWSLTASPGATLPRARELLHRSSLHLKAGEIDAALAAAARGAELADQSGHAPTRAWSRRSLGFAAFTRGDLETARRHYQASMDIACAAGDRDSVGRALDLLGIADVVAGDYASAESRFREALQIFRETRYDTMAAYMLNGVGNVHGVRGERLAALRAYEEALAMFEQLGDPEGTASMLINVGLTLNTLGRYREAIPLLTRALELSRTHADARVAAYSLTNLGNALEMDGRLGEAMSAIQESLALSERIGRADTIVLTLGRLGAMYHTLGNADQAREHFEKALALSEKIGFRAGVAANLHSLARTRLLGGDARGALALYEKVLALTTDLGSRAGVGAALYDIGNAQLRAGDRAAARQSFEKTYAVGEEIADRELMLVALRMQAEASEEGEESIALARRALEMATALGIPEQLWQSHLVLGRALRRAERLGEARTHFEQAVDIVEDVRSVVPGEEAARQRAFETMIEPYHEMVGILVAQGQPAAALEYAERAKGRVLLDVLRNGRPDLDGALTAGERARETKLSDALAALNRRHRAALVAGADATQLSERLRKARLEHEAFVMSLHAAHPQLRIERGGIEPAGLSDVAALLAGGSADAFLELVVTPRRTYLFTITTAGGVRVHTIDVAREELEADVRQFREMLATRDVAYAPAARALYDRLLRPAATQLRGAKTVGIVADGPLWELPFQALQPAPGEFVLDRHAVFYAPSLTVLREMTARPRRGGAARLLAFGNPVISGEATRRVREVKRDASLAPLPQTETEVRAIASLYEAGNRRVLLRDAAREEVVKREAAAFDVLHFATHGVLDDHNALYSRLVFSPSAAAGEDGLLEAREIMGLDLRADLAVLSACETARGRVGAGEGMIGMSWALFVAGVPTTVVSQWKVDSASTAELMVELHRGLRASGRTKAESLRRAALKTRAQPRYRHPFYWAPFVVVGSAR